MSDDSFIQPGQVALVGAGPGDPDLLTIAALKAFESADVLIYDALVSPEVLALIPQRCERVFAGKRGGKPSPSQEDVTDAMIRHAKAGKRVVRLKGGDPFVFGRGGEEAQALHAEGITFRVVPGLTAGVAGPAYAGIPVTHRQVNANVAFITGHESVENTRGEGVRENSRIDWEKVGQAFPVLVLYMAIKNLPMVTRRLIEGGRNPETPVAVIRWATTPRQQTLITTLRNAVADIRACGMEAPSIVVVGDVVDLRRELHWFPDETIDRQRFP